MPGTFLNLPTYSIAQVKQLVRGFVYVTALLFLFDSTIAFGLPAMKFSAQSVEHENFRMQGVQAKLEPGGGFSLDAQQLVIEGMERKLADFSMQGEIVQFSNPGGGLSLKSKVSSGGFTAVLEFEQLDELTLFNLKFDRVGLDALRGLDGLPPEFEWLRRGYLDAELIVRLPLDHPANVTVRLVAGDVSFDSPDGRYAAEALFIDTELSATEETWTAPRVKGSVKQGEVLIDDFYRDFAQGAIDFSLHPHWQQDRLDLRSISLTDNMSLAIEGRVAVIPEGGANAYEVEIARLDLEFPGAYQRYIEPVAAAWTLNGLGVTGHVSWSGQWSAGQFRSGILQVDDLSIVDTQRHRFAVTGLDAQMRPGDHAFDSRLAWRGLLVGRINLGDGEVALDSEPGAVAILRPLVLDVLGGQVKVHELKVLLPRISDKGDSEPDIRLRADIDGLDMEQLAAAFDWPSFSGEMSGKIPGVSLDDGVLDVEGQIQVSVFDGQIALADLRVERPFGVLPSLAANVEISGLNLEQLTSTFSFGKISGVVDGYVRDLRMLDWKPVAFDAWLGTPDSQSGSQGISRQAVNRLTTLGGGGATTALTSPIMRLFNSFSYKRLGLGCRMQNNVCELRGVSEDDTSVLLMEGAGVPKVTIRAFNRSVDWPLLLAQLTAASAGESIRVGEKPMN